MGDGRALECLYGLQTRSLGGITADTTTTNYALTKPGNLDAAGAGLWGPKLNTDFDLIDAELAKPRPIWVAPTVGATTTLDLLAARVFAFTVSQITTIAFSNVPTAAYGVTIKIILTNGSAFAVTWPAAVSWVSNVAPTLKAAGVDIIEMTTKDAGTTWYATLENTKPGVLYQNGGISGSVAGNNSIVSYSLPGNILTANQQMLRITIAGFTVTQPVIPILVVGANTISTFGSVAAPNFFEALYYVRRTGATTFGTSLREVNNATTALSGTTPWSATWSGAVTIDFRANVTAGGTMTYMNLLIEYLALA